MGESRNERDGKRVGEKECRGKARRSKGCGKEGVTKLGREGGVTRKQPGRDGREGKREGRKPGGPTQIWSEIVFQMKQRCSQGDLLD